MAETRATTFVGRDPANVVGVATGAAVAGALMTCLLRPEIGRYLTEAIALVCAMGAAGIALYLALLLKETSPNVPLRRWTARLAVVAFAAALLTMPFAVMDVSGDGLRGLGDGLAREVVLDGGDYQSVVARAAGLILLVVALRLRRLSRAALVVSAVLIVGSFLLMGHVRTHGPRAAVLAATFVHVGAAAAWFGGLLGLGAGLRRARADMAATGRLLAAFARTMSVVLMLLVAAGVGLAVLYLPSPRALVETAYGEVLLLKLAVIAATLVLSTANHRRLVPDAKSGNAAAVRVLRVNIVAEQVLLITVLVITEILMRQNPGG